MTDCHACDGSCLDVGGCVEPWRDDPPREPFSALERLQLNDQHDPRPLSLPSSATSGSDSNPGHAIGEYCGEETDRRRRPLERVYESSCERWQDHPGTAG